MGIHSWIFIVYGYPLQNVLAAGINVDSHTCMGN